MDHDIKNARHIAIKSSKLHAVVYAFHNSLNLSYFGGYGKALAFWEIQSKYTRKYTKNSVLSGLNLEIVDICQYISVIYDCSYTLIRTIT